MMDGNMTENQYSHASLSGMFSEDYLLGVQANLRDATGISFYFIDYKGTPVTDHDNKELFCSTKAKQDEFYQSCQLSYAMAAATSAIQGIPYIFNCPEGLLNIAVPIIVKNQYMGALIGGPILSEEGVSGDFDTIPGEGISIDYNEDVLPKYGKDRLEGIGQLVYRFVCEMGEKQSYHMDCLKYEHNVTHYDALRKRAQELTDRVEELVFRNLRMKMPTQLFLNLMTCLSNIAILEKAEKTETLISEFSYILRQYLLESSDRVSAEKELGLTEQYLRILEDQFDHAFDYRVNCQPMMESQLLPAWCMIPYVIYMVDAYLESRNTGGHFFIDVEQNGAMCRISMQMDAAGDSRKSRLGVISDRASILDLIDDTEKRFRHEYGDNYYISAGVERTILEIPVGS